MERAMTIELKVWHSLDGFRHILVKPGRKYIHALVMDGGLHVKRLPLEEEQFMNDPTGGTRAWSTVCKHFAHYGRRAGSTKGAWAFLAQARKQK
jgi:hypothetical protein